MKTKLSILFLLLELLSLNSLADDRLDILSGSQSPWSLQFILNYSGPSIETPLDKFAPNPSNDPVPPRVTLGGSMALRYRISEVASAGLGTGLQVDTPFQGPQNESMSNPTVDCSVMSEDRSRLQLFTYMFYTDPVYMQLGYASSIAYSLNSTWKLFDSNTWKLGIQFGGSYNFFQSESPSQLQDSLGVYPAISFDLSKNWSMRATSTLSAYQMRNGSQWIVSRFSQTIGAGWIWSKDIFLYAYVLFYPSPLANLNAKESSLGLSLIINLF